MILSSKTELEPTWSNTPCKQIQPLSRICLHGVSRVASLRRERIFVQSILQRKKSVLRFYRIPMSRRLTANMSRGKAPNLDHLSKLCHKSIILSF